MKPINEKMTIFAHDNTMVRENQTMIIRRQRDVKRKNYYLVFLISNIVWKQKYLVRLVL